MCREGRSRCREPDDAAVRGSEPEGLPGGDSAGLHPDSPKVTSTDLQNGFSTLASFTTKTTSDKDRNSNIALAAHASAASP